MFHSKPDRPYFESWLRRTGRHLAASGRLSQIASVLASENDGTAEEWSSHLRTVLKGEVVPSLDILTRIDALLTPPSRPKDGDQDSQGTLF